MESLSPNHIRQQALDALNPSDTLHMTLLTYKEKQALEDGHWDDVLATTNRRARRMGYAIWLLVVFLIALTSLHAFYTAGMASESWTVILRELLVPGMWLPFGLFALHAALKRSHELERICTMLELARDAEEAASHSESA
jgi:hypothetical protein